MRICCIFNSAPHYRREIYRKMEGAFDCSFVFGDSPVGSPDIGVIPPSEFRRARVVENSVVLRRPFYWQRGVLRELRGDFDAFILTGEPFCLSSWAFLLLARARGKKTMLWTHGWYGREGLAKRILKRAFFGLASGILLYGNYAKALMEKEGFNPDRMFVLHNSLAYERQLALRGALAPDSVYRDRFGNSGRTLVFVGRLTPAKRLDLLLRAAAALRSRGLDFNVAIVGDGSERASLESLAQSLGLGGSVWFRGACFDEAENARLIFNADMCVSPGNVGLTAVHSLMFGCPVATHDDFPNQMPEFEAVVPGKTGVFFRRGDAESIADAVQKWFETCDARDEVRRACYAEVDSSWNPDFQISVIKTAVVRLAEAHE